jgi:hypothetical protein
MWAEMGTNYYPNSLSNDAEVAIFSTDSGGYIPLPMRLISLFFSRIGTPAISIPYAYTLTSYILTGLLIGFFCSKVFRSVIESDLIRFVVSVFVLTTADFETRTYIGFNYFFLFLITVISITMFRSRIDSKILLIVPLLICSKPIMLATLPALGIAFISQRRNRLQISLGLSTVFLASIQILTILRSRENGLFIDQNDTSLIHKVLNGFVYFLATPSVIFDYKLVDNIFVRAILGLTILLVSLVLSFYCGQKTRITVLFSLMTIFCISQLNSLALPMIFNDDFFFIYNLSLNRYLIPTYHLFTLIFFALVSGIILKLNVGKFVFGTICTLLASLTLAILSHISSKVEEPKSPALFNSQWSSFARSIDSGESICVPLDPAGWTYQFGCRNLSPEFNWINFGGYGKSINLGPGRPLSIALPDELQNSRIMSVGLLVRPSSNQNGNLYLEIDSPSFGKFRVSIYPRLNLQGGQVFFSLPSDLTSLSNASIMLHSDQYLEVGLLDANSIRPAIIWYGV